MVDERVLRVVGDLHARQLAYERDRTVDIRMHSPIKPSKTVSSVNGNEPPPRVAGNEWNVEHSHFRLLRCQIIHDHLMLPHLRPGPVRYTPPARDRRRGRLSSSGWCRSASERARR